MTKDTPEILLAKLKDLDRWIIGALAACKNESESVVTEDDRFVHGRHETILGIADFIYNIRKEQEKLIIEFLDQIIEPSSKRLGLE